MGILVLPLTGPLAWTWYIVVPDSATPFICKKGSKLYPCAGCVRIWVHMYNQSGTGPQWRQPPLLAVTHVRVTLADCGETRLLSQAHGWSQGNSVFEEGDHSPSTETPQLFLDCTQGVAGKVGRCGKKTRVTDLEETPVPTAAQTSLYHWKVPAFVHSEIWFYFSS